MIKSIALNLLVLASATCCLAGDYFYNEAFFKADTVLPKLDFHRLNEIGSIKPVTLKCNILDRELREMLEEEGRDSQSTQSLMRMVAEIISTRQPLNHASEIADLELCAERAGNASSFSPPARRSPLVISNLDFRGLVDAVGSLAGDRKCLALEDELREQLDDYVQESTQLLTKVRCVVHKIGSHLAHSSTVYNLLTDCLGVNPREDNIDALEAC